MRSVVLFVCAVVLPASLLACDSCRTSSSDPETGGAVSVTAGRLATSEVAGERPKNYRWKLDTSFEYRNWDRVNPERALEINDTGGHQHGVIEEWFVNVRIAYAVTDNFELGISENYRHLRQVNVFDPLFLGQNEKLESFGDLELDAKYVLKRQQMDGFPVDLALFGSVKFPTGETGERTPQGVLFDAENQPGTGSWDGTLGVSASKRWGDWGASGAASFTLKTEGSQDFEAGDLFRLSAGASRKLKAEPAGWKLYPSMGVQGLIEFQGRDRGEIDRNHGGETIYAVPGFAAKPIDRLVLSVAVPVPVYQHLNGTHQKQDYSVVFSVGLRF
jgi:hypothetical protein